MRKVTKEEFYKKIGPLDVQVDVRGDYPYTSIFSTKTGKVVGKVVDRLKPNIYPPVTTYHLEK